MLKKGLFNDLLPSEGFQDGDQSAHYRHSRRDHHLPCPGHVGSPQLQDVRDQGPGKRPGGDDKRRRGH